MARETSLIRVEKTIRSTDPVLGRVAEHPDGIMVVPDDDVDGGYHILGLMSDLYGVDELEAFGKFLLAAVAELRKE